MLPNATKRLFLAHKTKIATSILTVIVLGLATFFAYTAYASGEKTLTLIKNGNEHTITTRANTVEELLKEQNINVDKQHDVIHPGLDKDLEDNMTVEWDESHQVTLSQDGKEKTIWTTADTVKELFDQQGIKINEHDDVEPSVEANITDAMSISVNNAHQITLFDGKKQQKIWSTEKTVGKFIDTLIKQNKISKLSEYDKLLPKDRNQVLEKTDTVKIIRVTKETVTEPEVIDYETVKQYDSSLEKGKTKVFQSGQEGKAEKTYEVTTTTDEKGSTKKKSLVKSKVISEPKKKIIAVGTKVVQYNTTSSRSLSSSSEKVLYMKSTAFTASCKGCNGITSLGINLKTHPNSKIIAVDPSVIPLGTKVWVEGYGYAIAGDTGGGIHGNKIDVFFPSKSQAYSWGVRTVKVKILN